MVTTALTTRSVGVALEPEHVPVRDARSRRTDEEDIGRDRLHREPPRVVRAGSVLDGQRAILDPDRVPAGDLRALVAAGEGPERLGGMARRAAPAQRDALAAQIQARGDVARARPELDPELGGHRGPVVVTVPEHAAALVVEHQRVAQGLRPENAVLDGDRRPFPGLDVNVAAFHR